MGRKPKGEPRSITERSRAGRFRFRRDVQHEIVAWLVMRGSKWMRAADNAAITAKENGDESTLNLAQAYYDRANICYSLASQICDEWSAVEWLGTLANIEAIQLRATCSPTPNVAASSQTQSGSSPAPKAKPNG